MYKSDSFNRKSTPDTQTNYKDTETFEYLNFHPCREKAKDFVRGEAQCFLRKDSSCSTFDKNTVFLISYL